MLLYSTETRSFAFAKRTACRSCLVDLVHCQHCFLRHNGLDIPDFSNWCLSRVHRLCICRISAFWQGTSHRCLSIMPSFSVTSANVAINDISLKTRFFGLHFRRRKSWCIFNHFYVISPIGTEFGGKGQSNGHYAIQGHRSWYQSKAHMQLPISD